MESMSITKDNIEKIVKDLSAHHYDMPELPKYKPGLIERFMNRMGWYRKTTVYIIDSARLKFEYPLYPSIIKEDKECNNQ